MKSLSKDDFDAIVAEHEKWRRNSKGRRAEFFEYELVGLVLPYNCTVSDCTVSDCTVSRGSVNNKPFITLKGYTGLYRYNIWAVLFEDGSRWVRMGCLFKSLEDWEKEGGIRYSNPREFPNDGSEKSEERVRAFEFAKAAAMKMPEEDASVKP